MENVSLWSVSLTMSGILEADWLGRGHPDKVLPFLTRIYLAVTDKPDSAVERCSPQTRVVTREKEQPRASGKSKRRHPDNTQKHPDGKGPLWTATEPIAGELHGVQKHLESSVHVIWVYESSAEPTPSYLWTAAPLATLSTLSQLLWEKQGNSRPVKDKRLFD